MPNRQVPQHTIEKWNAWRKWSARWNFLFYSVGSIQVALSVLVAVNTKQEKPIFPDPWNWVLAVAAAVFAFLVAALGAQAKGAAFETAGREIEKAVAAYETNPQVTDQDLGNAVLRGIDILNKLK
jgi:hypothetical protein